MNQKKGPPLSLAETMIKRAIQSSPMAMAAGIVSSSLPTVAAPSLDGLTYHPSKVAFPSEDDVLQRLDQLVDEHSTRREKPAGGIVEVGDEVTVDVLPYQNGNLLSFWVLRDAVGIIGDNAWIPGLDDALLGQPSGKTVLVSLLVGDDFPVAEARGKRAVLSVKIKRVVSLLRPNIESPEFLKAAGRGSHLDELMQNLALELDAQFQWEESLDETNRLMTALAGRVTETIPDELINESISRLWMQLEGRALMELNVGGPERDAALAVWLATPSLREDMRRRMAATCAVMAWAQKEKWQLDEKTLAVRLKEVSGDDISAESLLAQARAGDTTAKGYILHLAYLNAVEKFIGKIQESSPRS